MPEVSRIRSVATVQFIDESAEFLALTGRESFGTDEVGQERPHEPAAEFLGHDTEACADEGIAVEEGAKDMGMPTAVAGDVVLVFEAFEEFLDGGVVRFRATGIEGVGDLANGGLTTVPEDLEDRQFGIGHVAKGFHGADLLDSQK